MRFIIRENDFTRANKTWGVSFWGADINAHTLDILLGKKVITIKFGKASK